MLDAAQHDRVAGWVHDPLAPDEAVAVLVSIDGQPIERVEARNYREDLELAGFGNGEKSFYLDLIPPLSPLLPHLIEVRRARDGAHLPGSPCVLDAVVQPGPPVVATQDPRASSEDRPGDDSGSELEGNLDLVGRDRLAGWAHSRVSGAPVGLIVTVNEKLLARVLANRYRADLEQAGYGDGRRSFELLPTPPLSPLVRQIIEVRREEDGMHLPGSPRVIEPETAFGAEARVWMSHLLADADSESALEERVHYLASQLELLLQRRADRHGHRFERQLPRWTAPHSPGAPDEDRNPRGRLRALVIDERLPAPARDAGSNAILSHLASLQRLGFEVSFAAAEMSTESSAALAAANIAVCGLPWYASVEEVLRREAQCFDLVYLHRLPVANRYAALARHHQPKARLVYSVADLHYLRVSRQAVVEQRPELASLANRMQVAELLAISTVDSVITHSAHEAGILRRQVPGAKVHVVPWSIQVRPTSVPFEARRGIAFIGGYGHAPNVDAARWLIEEIVPLLRAREPDFECLLVGSGMPASLKESRPGIVALGAVEQIADIFDRVRLTVAPLTYGAGIKGKVLDSIAAGVPCVCTPIAAEGLELPDELLALVSDTAEHFAATTLRLHNDRELNTRVREAGLAYIQTRMSESRIDSLMRGAAGLPAPVSR